MAQGSPVSYGSEMRRFALSAALPVVGALCTAGLFAACASLTGYDDLRVASSDTQPEVVAEVSTDGASDSVVETPADAGVTAARIPSRPPGTVAPSGKGKTKWFVFSRYWMNQKDPKTDALSANAWRSIGYDLDKVCTGPTESKENTGTCRRPDGAKQDTLVDGDACRDNNFGSQVVPLVGVYDAIFEEESTTAVQNGIGTLILSLEDVDDGPNDPYVVGKVYKTANFKTLGTKPPAWDGTDIREITDDSVEGADLSKPKVLFEKGWIVDNLWVSGDGRVLDFPLPLANITVAMPLVAGRMTLELDATHENGKFGLVVGAIPRAKLDSVVTAIGDWAGICKGTTLYDGLVASVTRQCDVVVDAPDLQTTSATCDGISFAIGFSVKGVQPPTTVVPAPIYVPKCP